MKNVWQQPLGPRYLGLPHPWCGHTIMYTAGTKTSDTRLPVVAEAKKLSLGSFWPGCIVLTLIDLSAFLTLQHSGQYNSTWLNYSVLLRILFISKIHILKQLDIRSEHNYWHMQHNLFCAGSFGNRLFLSNQMCICILSKVNIQYFNWYFFFLQSHLQHVLKFWIQLVGKRIAHPTLQRNN